MWPVIRSGFLNFLLTLVPTNGTSGRVGLTTALYGDDKSTRPQTAQAQSGEIQCTGTAGMPAEAGCVYTRIYNHA